MKYLHDAIMAIPEELHDFASKDEDYAYEIGHRDARHAAAELAAAAQTPEIDPCRQELHNLLNAKRFDKSIFANDTEFSDWAMSRARNAVYTAAPPSSQARDLSDAEIVKCVESVGYKTWDNRVFKLARAVLAARGAK
jgi:hypothetical protein